MQVFSGLQELQAAVGSHLGFSDWVQIDQDRIDRFAEATGDHQWIHVDPEQAKTGPFGTTIAHGFLTLSLIPMLVWQIYRVDNTKLGINFGLDKVRFPAPVPVGSRLRAGVELLSVSPRSTGEQVSSRVTVDIEGADKPACIAETLAVLVF